MEFAVRYGPEPDQVADVFFPPDATGPAPLVLVLHGGSWRVENDRGYLEPEARALTANGYVVANVEYRRVGAGGGWPTTFTDVALAVDTLPELIEQRWPGRADTSRVLLFGHSAGGQLALWAAVRDRLPEGAPGRRSGPIPFAGVVAVAPVSALTEALRYAGGFSAVTGVLGGGPEDVPERYAAVDPLTLGSGGVPVVVIHGDRDTAVPPVMSRMYAEATGAELVTVPGVGHFDITVPGGPAWTSIVDAVARLAQERRVRLP
ncbi:alpha/beta hydrolase family protein [Amycolatopsis sp. NBC_01480]|uniref:alpha/beta hydrolase family protein n=1 Tax=Amycolatopsis sp. NBC_01480 TaxID=2903562 RepID=UPI002E284952|nr:alpha/beta hydrolase [Amycolatopsis sp. NBC_01480]